MIRPTAYLISCSDHYEHRFRVVDEQLKKMGYETVYLTSDFDHGRKELFRCEVPGCVQLHVRPYRRNLSVSRIYSHWQFAKKAVDYLDSLDRAPDVVICLLPPNFLARYLAGYKKRHKSVKLIFDIFDLWPETFPNARAKKILQPVFRVWAGLRDRNLPKADHMIAECHFFREKLNLTEQDCSVVYLSGAPLKNSEKMPELAEDRWDLCYLGAVNNVIDIPEICSLIRKMQQHKPVTLRIVGAGEQIESFVSQAEEAGATVVAYGPVYDDDRKQEILRQCHFGINIVRSAACIGLTMKSVEYFRHGLPVISNVPGDTRELVETKNVGIQYDAQTVSKLETMCVSDFMKMRKNVCTVFEQTFAEDMIKQHYRMLFDAWL